MSDASLGYAGYDGDERSHWERTDAWIDRRPAADFGVSEEPPSSLIMEPTPPVISVEIRTNRLNLKVEKPSSRGRGGSEAVRNYAEAPNDVVTRASIVQGVMGVIFLLIGFFAITLIALGLQKVVLIALAYGVPLGLALLYWCLRPSPSRNASA